MIFLKHAICIILTALSFFYGAAQDIRFRTLVIDPGHGGKDPGAISADKRTREKDVNLEIALLLEKMIKEELPDINVILTRRTDVFVALGDRAAIANKANADLFMSLHVNSCPRSTPHGFSVHVLGQSTVKDRDLFAFNRDICRRENSVIYMEDDYSTRYEGFDPSDEESFIFMLLMQNSHLEQSIGYAAAIDRKLKENGPFSYDRGLSQDPFFVLWKTSMPSVLIEMGFISNPGDLAVLRDPKKKEQIAACLFSAFTEWVNQFNESVSTAPAEPQNADL